MTKTYQETMLNDQKTKTKNQKPKTKNQKPKTKKPKNQKTKKQIKEIPSNSGNSQTKFLPLYIIQKLP